MIVLYTYRRPYRVVHGWCSLFSRMAFGRGTQLLKREVSEKKRCTSTVACVCTLEGVFIVPRTSVFVSVLGLVGGKVSNPCAERSHAGTFVLSLVVHGL